MRVLHIPSSLAPLPHTLWACACAPTAEAQPRQVLGLAELGEGAGECCVGDWHCPATSRAFVWCPLPTASEFLTLAGPLAPNCLLQGVPLTRSPFPSQGAESWGTFIAGSFCSAW